MIYIHYQTCRIISRSEGTKRNATKFEEAYNSNETTQYFKHVQWDHITFSLVSAMLTFNKFYYHSSISRVGKNAEYYTRDNEKKSSIDVQKMNLLSINLI